MNVAFLNENTLGHTSYLPRFAAELERRPELGIRPRVLDALPLPESLRRLGDTSIRGLRKFGLDFHITRWRIAISRHVRQQLDALKTREPVDALLINTQSAGLELDGVDGIPVCVGLDATFRQLSESPWFAPNTASRWLRPITLPGLLRRERALFRRTDRFLPWSERAASSLRSDYGIGPDRITVLPPSLDPPPRRGPRSRTGLPQILFLGGDFFRKGGPLLRQVFEQRFQGRAELHVVTQSDIPPGPGIQIHRGVAAGSEAWLRRWREADLFVFPSRLETFGIVLLEALAFEVPIIASDAGAAREILGGDRGQNSTRFGTLLTELTESALGAAIHQALADPEPGLRAALAGRDAFEERFTLPRNTERLAAVLSETVAARRR